MYRYYSHVKYRGIDHQYVAGMDNSNVDTSSVVSGVINALGLQSVSSNSNDGSGDETSSSSYTCSKQQYT